MNKEDRVEFWKEWWGIFSKFPFITISSFGIGIFLAELVKTYWSANSILAMLAAMVVTLSFPVGIFFILKKRKKNKK